MTVCKNVYLDKEGAVSLHLFDFFCDRTSHIVLVMTDLFKKNGLGNLRYLAISLDK